MKTRLIAFLVALSLSFVAVLAESAADIRRRIEQRLPAVEALKSREVVGENNRGLIEVRGNAADAAAVVAEENRDREAVYALIAKETGATADAVGRARAKQIAAKAPAGIWVQDEAGRWKKK